MLRTRGGTRNFNFRGPYAGAEKPMRLCTFPCLSLSFRSPDPALMPPVGASRVTEGGRTADSSNRSMGKARQGEHHRAADTQASQRNATPGPGPTTLAGVSTRDSRAHCVLYASQGAKRSSKRPSNADDECNAETQSPAKRPKLPAPVLCCCVRYYDIMHISDIFLNSS